MENQEDLKQFVEALQRIRDTEDGTIFLQALKDQYINRNAFNSEPTSMAYLLGQKELAQSIVNTAELESLPFETITDITDEE